MEYLKIKNQESKNNNHIFHINYHECPAKTYDTKNGKKIGRSVESHCKIVGSIAQELIHLFPEKIRAFLFPQGSQFTAATHDIGKVSPTFYNKIMCACGNSKNIIHGYENISESEWGGHAGVSQATAEYLDAPKFIPEVLGQHHGFSPKLGAKLANDEIFGDETWQREREKLVKNLELFFSCSWPKISNEQSRILAGLTCVADWIGSGSFFEDPKLPWQPNIKNALKAAGIIQSKYKPKLTFSDIFGFSPREPQIALIEQISAPGVYVLEAPMGIGKTEAALFAAYKMLSLEKATGIYFALPTQITSNKIYDRFKFFLEKILAHDCPHRSLLLHANAWLYETEMGEEGSPGGSWFDAKKRGLLAPFSVGTIDQALMAVMNVKHGFVRAFGLAGKVVILDEVHTYDSYTGTILDELVSFLQKIHCTVIILSATLHKDRRNEMIKRDLNTPNSEKYPLITSCPIDKEPHEIGLEFDYSSDVQILMQADVSLAIEESLLRASKGQQILWIENTVQEAQQIYLDLSARCHELNIECGLLHSRFTFKDRQRIEEKWVNLYGKNNWEKRTICGRILVGTQVLEQSLDIDSDFLITKMAPTDMLLQRLGRLWRHLDTPRNDSAKCEAWILAPDLKFAIENPLKHFGKTAHIYSSYVLCRSLETWIHLTHVKIPNDIRKLIDHTYKSREENGHLKKWLSELHNGTKNKKGIISLKQSARLTLSKDGTTLAESKAQTRYSESDNFDVLILKEIKSCKEKKSSILKLIDGQIIEIPWKKHTLNKKEWRKITSKLMRQIVPINETYAPQLNSLDNLRRLGFENCFYLGNPDWSNEQIKFRVVCVNERHALKDLDGSKPHEKYELEYRNDLGYRNLEN